MKLTISENIRNLRRERKMTQEQLAEALGVSFAAVSKWERGASVPELGCIMELAGIFGVSVDALLGYQMRSNAVRDIAERIEKLKAEKDFTAAAAQAEKALTRYPNDFDLVYRCGEMYQVKGIETGDRESLKRAVELMERAVLLLPQNTDPEINEAQIRSAVARCCIGLGREEEGIEIFKRCNVGGVHNAQIGFLYSTSDRHKAEDAAVFLTKAFAGIFENVITVISGYVNYYEKLGDLTKALDAALWLTDFLESVREPEWEVSYADKILALFYAECAQLSYKTGKADDVKPFLKKAYRLASAFDEAPTYNIHSMRFCVGDIKKATAYDDMGKTAIQGVEADLYDQWEKELIPIWEELKNEK